MRACSVLGMLVLVLVLAASASADAPAPGTISSIAGDFDVSGPATSLGLYMTAITSDPSGSLYVADSASNSVREVDPSGFEKTVAGGGFPGYAGDGGPAAQAEIGLVSSLTVDRSGNLLIADGTNDVVRLVAASGCTHNCPYGLASTRSGDIYTVAGDATAGDPGDGGPATAAAVVPGHIAVDAHDDLLIEGAYRVRIVAASACSSACPYGLPSMARGHIYEIAGDGHQGSSGDSGAAIDAELSGGPIAVDRRGNLLIGGTAELRVVAVTGCPSGCPYALGSMVGGDIYPVPNGDPVSGLAVDRAGNILMAGGSDVGQSYVDLLAASDCSSDCPYGVGPTVAGQRYAVAGGGVDGGIGPATKAFLDQLVGIAVGADGDLLIAEDHEGDGFVEGFEVGDVRLVPRSACPSGCPYGLPSTIGGDIYAVVGNDSRGYAGDGGIAAAAELNDPSGLAIDRNGNVLVADTGNRRIRLIAEAGCSGDCPYGLASTVQGHVYTVAGGGGGHDDAPAIGASLIEPSWVAADGAGGLLIGDGDDLGNRFVRFVAAQSCSSACPYGLPSTVGGNIYTVVGNPDDAPGGPATMAGFFGLTGLDVDPSGNVLISAPGQVLMLARSACDASCVYGLASTVAGGLYPIAGIPGGGVDSGDGGPATKAVMGAPVAATLDGRGDVLVSENTTVRLIAAANCSTDCPYGLPSTVNGYIYTVAGTGTPGDAGDGGPARSAQIQSTVALAVDGAGDVALVDLHANVVRLVASTSCSNGCPYGLPSMVRGDIYAIAGTGTLGYSADGGPAVATPLAGPSDVAAYPGGNLLISDTKSGRIREVSAGSASLAVTVTGTGTVTGGAVDCPSSCNVTAAQGATVTLSANPGRGSTFVGWTGGGCSGTGTCAVMLVGDRAVEARFSATGPTGGSSSRAEVRAALAALLKPSGKASGLRTIGRRGGFRFSFDAPSAGRLVIDWFRRVHHHDALVASAVVTIRRAGRAAVKVKLTRRGRNLLKGLRRVKLTAKCAFTPVGGGTTTASGVFTLTRSRTRSTHVAHRAARRGRISRGLTPPARRQADAPRLRRAVRKAELDHEPVDALARSGGELTVSEGAELEFVDHMRPPPPVGAALGGPVDAPLQRNVAEQLEQVIDVDVRVVHHLEHPPTGRHTSGAANSRSIATSPGTVERSNDSWWGRQSTLSGATVPSSASAGNRCRWKWPCWISSV